MPAETLQMLFTGKSFRVPSYQRDFAWKLNNFEDLFDDLREAIETRSKHYIGAFILSKGDRAGCYKVVDGQQRLTALTMLLNALIPRLTNEERRIVFSFLFLKDPESCPRLYLSGENQDFFLAMVNGKNPNPCSESQKRLTKGYQWIREQVALLPEEQVLGWVNCINDLEVLELVETDEGKAIRMFQSVNDRGVPLSNMDKAKSLLIYYSNRFLEAELDEFVDNNLGQCFKDYSQIKTLAAETGFHIKTIEREAFTEDDILRYHYLAFDPTPYVQDAGFDFYATSDFVLNSFLKKSLKGLRDKHEELKSFIRAYVSDLRDFFSALRSALEGTRTSEALFQLFVVLDLSAALYPLTIRLQARGVLTNALPDIGNFTLESLIEIADLRVYKLRGTNPTKDVYTLSREASRLSTVEIANALRKFVLSFMNDSLFQSRLETEDIYKNPGLYRILTEIEKSARVALQLPRLDLADLKAMVADGQSIEHILPQNPSCGFPSYGFENREEYDQANNRLGNLTLLTSGENSRCSNQPIENKVSEDNLYKSSKYQMTRRIAAKAFGRRSPFYKLDIDDRSSELAKQCVLLWPVWGPFETPLL